jgi:hypothetical protein
MTHDKGDKQTKWVMDITGGQFGVYNPFWKWDDYVEHFVNPHLPMRVYPFGTNKICLHKIGKLPGWQSLRQGVVGDVAKSMNEAITAFEKSQGLTLDELLLLTTRDHNMRKAALLATIVKAIDAYKGSERESIKAKCLAATIFDIQHPGVSLAQGHKGWVDYFEQSPHKDECLSGPGVFVADGKIHIVV